MVLRHDLTFALTPSRFRFKSRERERRCAPTCDTTLRSAENHLPRNGIVADKVSMWWPDGTPVLCDISLHVPPGKIGMIMGTNGCGKSTLMHVLSGFRLPDEGSVHVEAPLCYIHQDPNIQLFMPTVSLNLTMSLPGTLQDCKEEPTRDEIRGICLRALESMELHPSDMYLKMRVRDLSGGEKQRVAIAAALVAQPQALLFDEVTANLDKKGRAMVVKMVERLVREQNISCLWVSHLHDELAIADYVYLMDSGCVVARGSPKEMLPLVQDFYDT